MGLAHRQGCYSTLCPAGSGLRVIHCGEEWFRCFFAVGWSLTHTVLYPGFIFCCSSNPPAVSLTLLCWRTRVIKPFLCPSCRSRNTFSAIWPLVQTYLTVWETKSVSHFLSLSLSLCDVVSLSQLVTCYHHSRHIQAETHGGLRGIWVFLFFLSVHVQLYEEVPVCSPSGLRKWSRCKASGSRNPVGHRPCCSRTAPCKILHSHLSAATFLFYKVLLHTDFSRRKICRFFNAACLIPLTFSYIVLLRVFQKLSVCCLSNTCILNTTIHFSFSLIDMEPMENQRQGINHQTCFSDCGWVLLDQKKRENRRQF